MKKQRTLWNSVSLLIVAVLVITAFVRGQAQLWLYSAAFAVWSAWAVTGHLIPYLRAKQRQREARRIRQRYEQEQRRKQECPAPDLSDPVGAVLLRHVNYRISTYLKSAYPEATWAWREEFPERIVSKGGTGRIQVYGIPDFNYADVSFTQSADIQCSLVKIVPLSKLQGQKQSAESKAPQPAPVDPQIWYEKQGRVVLENLVNDLNSRGHSRLTISENGDISVQQGDAQVRQSSLENMPEKMYWPRLAKVFEREGLAANITESGMVLSW